MRGSNADRLAAPPFKRTRDICLQIYVFSQAAVLGWAGGEALARRGCDYLAAKA